MKNNILLIGFMGVGKSTIGRMLCKKDKFFLDTDDLIQSFYGGSVASIFSEHSQEYFRELESRVGEWLCTCVSNSIIATGGGFYNSYDVRKIGKVIYLKSDFDNIIQRLRNESDFSKEIAKRPLLSDLSKARELYDNRISDYESLADEVISVDNLSLNEIVNKVAK